MTPTSRLFADAIRTLERHWYTDAELAEWLTAPQPLIDGKTPIELLAEGRKAEILNVIRALDEGTLSMIPTSRELLERLRLNPHALPCLMKMV